jgi:HD superfamily phosphodiesterase
MIPKMDTPEAWRRSAPHVPAEWFNHASHLHTVRHTQRVHIHAQRLVRALAWPDQDAGLALSAALWHDIGRTDDSWDPDHGALSARRAVELGLTDALPEEDAGLVLFAVRFHSLSDLAGEEQAPFEADPDRALRVLRLLKDADALDRVRLADWEGPDPDQMRNREAVDMIPFARELCLTLR